MKPPGPAVGAVCCVIACNYRTQPGGRCAHLSPNADSRLAADRISNKRSTECQSTLALWCASVGHLECVGLPRIPSSASAFRQGRRCNLRDPSGTNEWLFLHARVSCLVCKLVGPSGSRCRAHVRAEDARHRSARCARPSSSWARKRGGISTSPAGRQVGSAASIWNDHTLGDLVALASPNPGRRSIGSTASVPHLPRRLRGSLRPRHLLDLQPVDITS